MSHERSLRPRITHASLRRREDVSRRHTTFGAMSEMGITRRLIGFMELVAYNLVATGFRG
jgi:ABC-type phosphate/phosphonate transport system permease subunit